MRSEETLNRWTLAGLVAGGIVVLDQLTKRWAQETLPGNPIVVWEGWLAFVYAENTGSAFGFFPGAGAVIAVIGVFAVALLLWMLREAGRNREVVGLGLVGGGAIGNLVDRVTRGDGLVDGAVVDFIKVPLIPNFNVADAALTVGVGLLLVVTWLSSRHAE